MQITLASVMVKDQEKALKFYVEALGFTVKHDIPMGPFRWLTVSSPDGVDGVELSLESTAFPPSRTYQEARYEAGMPATAFVTKDIQREYARLKERGVVFRSEPQNMGPISSALFEDTCGNWINLVQPAG